MSEPNFMQTTVQKSTQEVFIQPQIQQDQNFLNSNPTQQNYPVYMNSVPNSNPNYYNVQQQPIIVQPNNGINFPQGGVYQQPIIVQPNNGINGLIIANTCQSQNFPCEIDENHKGILTHDKCYFCNKMCCLKCLSQEPIPQQIGRRTLIYQKACIKCAKKLIEANQKYGWIMIFHILMIFLGSFFLFPFSFVGLFVGLIMDKKIPNDTIHQGLKRQNKMFTLIHIILFIFLIFTFILIAVSVLPSILIPVITIRY